MRQQNTWLIRQPDARGIYPFVCVASMIVFIVVVSDLKKRIDLNPCERTILDHDCNGSAEMGDRHELAGVCWAAEAHE